MARGGVKERRRQEEGGQHAPDERYEGRRRKKMKSVGA